MKRFSIGFDEDEYSVLEDIQRWYKEHTGVRVSKCGVIKALLFESWRLKALNSVSEASKNFKSPSKAKQSVSLSANLENEIYREDLQATE